MLANFEKALTQLSLLEAQLTRESLVDLMFQDRKHYNVYSEMLLSIDHYIAFGF